jgi:hypothetical protein
VSGKPRQQLSDCLGLLLRKAAAGLAAQQLHLDGEPWRPWSWPSAPAAALADGGSALACRWRGQRIGVEHARLLARPRLWWRRWPSTTAGGGGKCRTRPRVVSRSRRSGRPRGPVRPRRERSRSHHDPCQGCTATLNQRRRCGPRRPRHGSRPTTLLAWATPAQPGSAYSPEPSGSRHGGSAAVQSAAGQRLVHRSICHPPLSGAAEADHAIPTRRHRVRGPGMLQLHPLGLGREPLAPRRTPTPFDRLQNL